MKNETNIIESVEFLAADDLLVAELDKRLSFTALGDTGKSCTGFGGGICGCFAKSFDCANQASGVSAVRG
ncbi:MAG TPA: hypothetical protein DEQ38_01890 [Elusimicrobia bacterium]|nr:MAG: hypothetical protein A2089_07575 [Elusimicrobia bacterium GWD2_63_28]HCC46860.1 hypothetical protein [Elusimicrobiota bacterium]